MRGSNFFFLYYICSLLHIYHAENSLLTKAFAITETAVVKRDETRLGRLSKYKPTEHPWTSFGRVRRRKKGSQKWSGVCTGTLVGRRLILTARHCRLDEFEEVKFYPALYDGYSKDPEASASISAVWKSSNNWEPNPECAILNDWAFALLDKPLGDRFGYVQVIKHPSDIPFDKRVLSWIGYMPHYSDGEVPYKQTQVKLYSEYQLCNTHGPLVSDADTHGGASGTSLIFQDERDSQWYTVGALYGEAPGQFYRDKVKKTGAQFSSGMEMIQTYYSIRHNFDFENDNHKFTHGANQPGAAPQRQSPPYYSRPHPIYHPKPQPQPYHPQPQPYYYPQPHPYYYPQPHPYYYPAPQ